MEPSIIKRQKIIFTTIDLIHEYGIQGVSTREVARRQGISQGTIFQYFPTKKDLFAAVLDHFSLYDSDLFRSTELRNMNPIAAIIYYIDACATYHENYPAITALNQAFEVLQSDQDLGDQVKHIFINRSKFVKKWIGEAKTADMIKKEADSDILADIITSTQRGICLDWRINGCQFPLREKTLQAVNMILEAFRA